MDQHTSIQARPVHMISPPIGDAPSEQVQEDVNFTPETPAVPLTDLEHLPRSGNAWRQRP